MRTVQQALHRVGGAPEVPDDFPAGPFASLDMHIDRIKAWSMNSGTGGGVFKIREKEVREAQKRVGATARLVCNREGHAPAGTLSSAGSAAAPDIPAGLRGRFSTTSSGGGQRNRGSWRCNCKWAVGLEVVAGVDGAQQCASFTDSLPPPNLLSVLALCANLLCLFGRSICVSAKLDHNHPLPQTLEASLPFAHSHEIPEELERVARDMAGWKLPHDIHNMLCRMASARRFPVSWTERDIQNRYPMLSGTPWQAEELLEKLATAGQAYQKHVDSESGVLQNLIWIQHQGDMEVVLSAEQCVIFDNTFNTNSL